MFGLLLEGIAGIYVNPVVGLELMLWFGSQGSEAFRKIQDLPRPIGL